MSKRFIRILNIDWVEPRHQVRLKEGVHEVYDELDGSVCIYWPDCLPVPAQLMPIFVRHRAPAHLALNKEDGDDWEYVALSGEA